MGQTRPWSPKRPEVAHNRHIPLYNKKTRQLLYLRFKYYFLGRKQAKSDYFSEIRVPLWNPAPSNPPLMNLSLDPPLMNFPIVPEEFMNWTEWIELTELNEVPCPELNWTNWQPNKSGRRVELNELFLKTILNWICATQTLHKTPPLAPASKHIQ